MKNTNFYRCGNCGLNNNGICLIRNCGVAPDDYCGNHCTEPYVCDNCHRIVLQPLIWTREDGQIKVLCKECFRRL